MLDFEPRQAGLWGSCRRIVKVRCSSNRAFTLLEILVATAITMLMMLFLVRAFKSIGDSMKEGRAALHLNNALRSATFRLRQDLNNLSLRVDPPTDFSSGAGYLEYFDGSMTDYTCAMFDKNNELDSGKLQEILDSGGNLALALKSSRFGDLDDILMFTARAGDTPFVGKVPWFVLDKSLLLTPSRDIDGNGIEDWRQPVAITSQFAEIIVFARPVHTDLTKPYFDDFDGNNLPDAYQLYYRALLIRPDLNTDSITVGGKNESVLNSTPGWLYVGSKNPPRPLDMALVHQQCDLSLRRVYDGLPGYDRVAANSLEDLVNPANRFAHFEYPLSTLGRSTTMPLLVFEPIPQSVFNPGSLSATLADPDPGTMAGMSGNFLHPDFVLQGDRLGEDILSTDCLAFDVKVFDSGVPVVGLVGEDGVPGVPGVSTGLGDDGSDDVVITPNDPAYARSFFSPPSQISSGAYVDLMWGRKAQFSLSYYKLSPTSWNPRWGTEFSGYDAKGSFIDGLQKSGKVLYSNVNRPFVLQPAFDTWSSHYEKDGELQAKHDVLFGIVNYDRFKIMSGATGTDVPNSQVIDRATDGIDNNSNGGVDDAFELETLPPFPVKLRSLKVSIRLEDRPTRQIKQMSVAREFVTQ